MYEWPRDARTRQMSAPQLLCLSMVSRAPGNTVAHLSFPRVHRENLRIKIVRSTKAGFPVLDSGGCIHPCSLERFRILSYDSKQDAFGTRVKSKSKRTSDLEGT